MSGLLGDVAVGQGLRVRGSEVLGMAVRGGSVMSVVRIGDDVHGPLIPMGKGDILVGMEPAEALRNITYMSGAGLVILNTTMVVPYTVTLGAGEYPPLETIIDRLKRVVGSVVALDATRIAEEAGSPMAANMVMMGALLASERLPIPAETMKEAIQASFSPKLAPVNLKAFDLGYQRCRQALK